MDMGGTRKGLDSAPPNPYFWIRLAKNCRIDGFCSGVEQLQIIGNRIDGSISI